MAARAIPPSALVRTFHTERFVGPDGRIYVRPFLDVLPTAYFEPGESMRVPLRQRLRIAMAAFRASKWTD